jgi:hypothetical protein
MKTRNKEFKKARRTRKLLIFCENVRENKYFRENVSYVIKIFSHEWSLYFNVAYKFYLFVTILRKSQHWFIFAEIFAIFEIFLQANFAKMRKRTFSLEA